MSVTEAIEGEEGKRGSIYRVLDDLRRFSSDERQNGDREKT